MTLMRAVQHTKINTHSEAQSLEPNGYISTSYHLSYTPKLHLPIGDVFISQVCPGRVVKLKEPKMLFAVCTWVISGRGANTMSIKKGYGEYDTMTIVLGRLNDCGLNITVSLSLS